MIGERQAHDLEVRLAQLEVRVAALERELDPTRNGTIVDQRADVALNDRLILVLPRLLFSEAQLARLRLLIGRAESRTLTAAESAEFLERLARALTGILT